MCGINHWQIGAEVEVLSMRDYCLWLLVLLYYDVKEHKG